MEAIAAGITFTSVVVSCALHYSGVANLCRRGAAWLLEVARSADERQQREGAALAKRLGGAV